MIKVNLDGGRKNWVAEFPVSTVREHVERLLDHHSRRFLDEEKEAQANRDKLVEATKTATIPDPNRTQPVTNEYENIRRDQAKFDGAVTNRKRNLGELARWLLFLKMKGDDALLLLTIEDLEYFRMGEHDLDDPDLADTDYWR